MPDRDNKLGKAKDLGFLGSSPLSKSDRLSLTDLDDLYHFSLSDRRNVELSLSSIAKGADLDIELYALKGNQIPGKMGSLDFRKLRKVDLNASLQLKGSSRRKGNLSEQISIDNLDAGHYFVRVKQRKGSSRYQLDLSAQAIPK